MAFTMTEASQILKTVYLPTVREQIPTKTPLFSRLEKSTEDVVGSDAKLALRVGRNQGIGARADGGTLPTAGNQKYRNFSVSTKNIYGRIELAGKVFRAAKTDRGAFINAVEAELKGMTEGFQWELNRQLFGDGTGRLGYLSTLSGGSTYNTLTNTGAPNGSYKTRWLYPDMRVQVYDTSLTTARSFSSGESFAVIKGVDNVNGLVELVSSTGAACNVTGLVSGDTIVREGSLNNEITGLFAVLAEDQPLYGIDRGLTQNKFFNPQVVSAGGSITDVILQTAWDQTEVNAGGSPTLMISTHAVRRAYQDLMQELKRYTEPKKLQGGYTALDYNGTPWVVDPDMVGATIYFLDESTWKIHTMIGELFDWGEEDGQVMRQVANKDAYEAFMVSYLELVCDTPSKNVKLTNVLEA